MARPSKENHMAKRVKYMETGYIGVVSDDVAAVYAKKKFKEGKEIKILGDAKDEPKPKAEDKDDKK